MVFGISFWLWIGYDEKKKESMYVFGENALEILLNLAERDCFDDDEIDLTAQMKKNGLTREDLASTIQIGENWEDAERKADMDPLSTWEIVDLISEEIRPRYRQIMLLEISPENEKIYDYSKNRDKTKDDMLESRSPLQLETTIITDNELQTISTVGPERACWELINALRKRGTSLFRNVRGINYDLRYLKAGQCMRFDIGRTVLFIKATNV